MKERERLFETIEQVRADKYPDLDSELIETVVTEQIRMQDDRAEARRRTEQAITRRAKALVAQNGEEQT